MSAVQPSQVAALLGREIDAGLAAALADVGGSRAVVVDRIVARVGALGDGGSTTDPSAEPDWSAVQWQAEVTLQPSPAGTPVPGTSAPGPTPDPDPSAALRHRIALLPIRAVRGVGPGWARTFAQWGHPTIGELAEADIGEVVRRAGARAYLVLPLLARARDLVGPWPPLPPSASGRTVAAVAMATPDPDSPATHAVRAHCLRVIAALDADVVRVLRLP